MYARRSAHRHGAGPREISMKPMRWLAVAISVGCLAVLGQPGQAQAAIHHALSHAAPRASLHRLHRAAPTSVPRPSRRAPSHAASRVANHARPHGGKSRNRQQNSSHAANSTASIEQSLILSRLALEQASSHDLSLNKTLESRGPPRASPRYDLARSGLQPPSTALLSSSKYPPRQSQDTQGHPSNSVLYQVVRPRPSLARLFGSPHADRIEGSAACHVTPSSGGVSA